MICIWKSCSVCYYRPQAACNHPVFITQLRIVEFVIEDGFYCPLYFSYGLGTAKGYIPIKYVKNERFQVMLRTCLHRPHVVHSCGAVIIMVSYNDTFITNLYLVCRKYTSCRLSMHSRWNLNTSYIQYILLI